MQRIPNIRQTGGSYEFTQKHDSSKENIRSRFIRCHADTFRIIRYF